MLMLVADVVDVCFVGIVVVNVVDDKKTDNNDHDNDNDATNSHTNGLATDHGPFVPPKSMTTVTPTTMK